MKLLLDTHVFLWLINGDSRLSPDTLDKFRNPANEIYLSVASVWEATIKYDLGKLVLPESPAVYLPRQRMRHSIESLLITEETLKYLGNLPGLHRDPFDRILICQALHENLTIVTLDSAIRQYPVATL